MLDDTAKIGQATYDGLRNLLNIEFIFWYDYLERGSILQLEFYFGCLPQTCYPSLRKHDRPDPGSRLMWEMSDVAMEESCLIPCSVSYRMR